MPHRLLRFRGVSLRLSGQVFRSVNHEGAYQRTDRSVEGSARPAAGRDKGDESGIAPPQSPAGVVAAPAAAGGRAHRPAPPGGRPPPPPRRRRAPSGGPRPRRAVGGVPPLSGKEMTVRGDGHPQTSLAVSTIRRSLATWSSQLSAFPSTVE